MQSSGGLADAMGFQGKDAILSGPAGGIVGVARTAAGAGLGRLISFDIGGTSTDVAPTPANSSGRSIPRWPASACARR